MEIKQLEPKEKIITFFGEIKSSYFLLYFCTD